MRRPGRDNSVKEAAWFFQLCFRHGTSLAQNLLGTISKLLRIGIDIPPLVVLLVIY